MRTPPTPCPAACGYMLDAVTGLTGAQMPEEGDFSLCINCGSFLTYNKDLTMRVFTYDELVDLDTETRKTLHAIHESWYHVTQRKGQA